MTMTDVQIDSIVNEEASGTAACEYIRQHRPDVYGPTQDEAAIWATLKGKIRVRELNKLRAIWYVSAGGAEPIEEIRAAIKNVVLRLPLSAQEFCFTRCRFISFSPAVAGYCVPADFHAGKFVIMINELTPTEDLETVIAHEIAHTQAGFTIDDREGDELRAEGLAGSWGFKSDVFATSLTALAQKWDERERLRVVAGRTSSTPLGPQASRLLSTPHA